ncbi:MAG: D-glycero-beta-D-manno-heptose 1,7-bisphosphate 7-phosphatase [Syntrophales bacterium]|jgi:D,D-heptose 1,7-bisphosphate phosphatase|nr:D-glycero-beta-D-manno-heptose 1,7-bisphosphate 7-phosphatase [Syntrophales bacterium]MDY0044516.1 D-glycero-beta-D-manno-heptose 1,7-bisphosphate 7-phosphatase [Syntrophales bacterium]
MVNASIKKNNRAVFFDRDGTLNEDMGYLSNLDQLRLYPCAGKAVRLVNEMGMKAVVITNQSGIARGYFDEEFVITLHEKISELLESEGARIDRFYFCPHHPEEGKGPYKIDCFCRKPKPGMLLQAAEDINIDLARSFMIGDMIKDIEAAENAGAKGILVKTGYGREIMSFPEAAYVAEDVLDAVQWIRTVKDNEYSLDKIKRNR